MSQLTTSKPEVIVEKLVYAYSKQEPILREISFNLYAGERVALMGATGSGKSTLLENLIGLKEPTSGKIWIRGTPVENKNFTRNTELYWLFFSRC